MRPLVGVLVLVAMACGATSARSQEDAPPDVVRAAEASNAAFRCAVLAAISVPTGEPSPDTIRLAKYALPLARKFNEWMVPRMLDRPATVGPWRDFLAEVDTDFWVGMAYANASQWVEQRMSILAPLTGGESSEDWSLRRQLEARAEYTSQNCNLLGP